MQSATGVNTQWRQTTDHCVHWADLIVTRTGEPSNNTLWLLAPALLSFALVLGLKSLKLTNTMT